MAGSVSVTAVIQEGSDQLATGALVGVFLGMLLEGLVTLIGTCTGDAPELSTPAYLRA